MPPSENQPEKLAPTPLTEGATECEEVCDTQTSLNNHHSSSDWLYNLRTLPNSSVLREIKKPVMTLGCWSTLVGIVHKFFLLNGKAGFAAGMCMPHAGHSFLVSTLGLLLVFRTNSAYQRFQEGRKIWEQLLTTSRNFSRMATLYRHEVGEDRLLRIKNLMASFPYLLRHHIRSGCLCRTKELDLRLEPQYQIKLRESIGHRMVDSRYEGDASNGGIRRPEDYESSYKKARPECYVDRRDLPWRLLDGKNQIKERNILFHVAAATNRPLWICDRLGKEILDIPLTPTFTSRERMALLDKVDKLTSTIGECERIQQTSVPLNYARHALRGLTLWLFTLPFCLVKDLGMMTGPVTASIAWLMFGVYQIGHSIEDPFQGSLRLSMLCDSIRRDVLGTNDNNSLQEEDGTISSAFTTKEDDTEASVVLPEPRNLNLRGMLGDLESYDHLVVPQPTELLSFS